jgi:hypothetical protein
MAIAVDVKVNVTASYIADYSVGLWQDQRPSEVSTSRNLQTYALSDSSRALISRQDALAWCTYSAGRRDELFGIFQRHRIAERLDK